MLNNKELFHSVWRNHIWFFKHTHYTSRDSLWWRTSLWFGGKTISQLYLIGCYGHWKNASQWDNLSVRWQLARSHLSWQYGWNIQLSISGTTIPHKFGWGVINCSQWPWDFCKRIDCSKIPSSHLHTKSNFGSSNPARCFHRYFCRSISDLYHSPKRGKKHTISVFYRWNTL